MGKTVRTTQYEMSDFGPMPIGETVSHISDSIEVEELKGIIAQKDKEIERLWKLVESYQNKTEGN